MKERNYKEIKSPPPGSNSAIDDYGCTCPNADNNRGIGIWSAERQEFLFWIDEHCSLHADGENRIIEKIDEKFI